MSFSQTIDGQVTWAVVHRVTGQYGAPDPSDPYVAAAGLGAAPDLVDLPDILVDAQGRTRWFHSVTEAREAAIGWLRGRIKS